jgi:hypothetical protein
MKNYNTQMFWFVKGNWLSIDKYERCNLCGDMSQTNEVTELGGSPLIQKPFTGHSPTSAPTFYEVLTTRLRRTIIAYCLRLLLLTAMIGYFPPLFVTHCSPLCLFPPAICYLLLTAKLISSRYLLLIAHRYG